MVKYFVPAFGRGLPYGPHLKNDPRGLIFKNKHKYFGIVPAVILHYN